MSDTSKNIWPETLLIRDTQLHDDMGGGGQRIYTTAGRGYEKRKYIRADALEAKDKRIAELERINYNLTRDNIEQGNELEVKTRYIQGIEAALEKEQSFVLHLLNACPSNCKNCGEAEVVEVRDEEVD